MACACDAYVACVVVCVVWFVCDVLCDDVWFAFVCLLLGCASSTCVSSVSHYMLLYGMCFGVRLCVSSFTRACVRCL